MPGASVDTVNGALVFGWPAEAMVRVCGPVPMSEGIKTLICVGETKYSGRISPPTMTVTPPSVCTMGFDGPTAVACARLAPNIDTTDPGATTACGVTAAPLITPPAITNGTEFSMAVTARGEAIEMEPEGAGPLRSPAQERNW